MLRGIWKFGSRFCVNNSQQFAETYESSPTAQLQGARLRLDIIACVKWSVRGVGVSRASPTSEPVKRDAYVKLPDVVEKDNAARGLLKPLYWLSSACKE